MDFPALKQDGRIVFSTVMSQLKDNFLARIKDGTPLVVSIKRVDQPGSYQQLKCHFGLVVRTIRQVFGERGMDLATFLGSPTIPAGLEVPVDVIQAVLYATCGDVGENGEHKTLSKMNVMERCAFFEKVRNYSASAWDIQIPDPDPAWMEKRR